MDDRIIEAASDILNCSYDEAEKFLNDECGAYASIGGEKVWLSGKLVYEIAAASLTFA